MKKYIVIWKKEEKEFTDIHEAIEFAEKTAESGCYTSVRAEVDGKRDEQPFFTCTWEI